MLAITFLLVHLSVVNYHARLAHLELPFVGVAVARFSAKAAFKLKSKTNKCTGIYKGMAAPTNDFLSDARCRCTGTFSFDNLSAFCEYLQNLKKKPNW